MRCRARAAFGAGLADTIDLSCLSFQHGGIQRRVGACEGQ